MPSSIKHHCGVIHLRTKSLILFSQMRETLELSYFYNWIQHQFSQPTPNTFINSILISEKLTVQTLIVTPNFSPISVSFFLINLKPNWFLLIQVTTILHSRSDRINQQTKKQCKKMKKFAPSELRDLFKDKPHGRGNRIENFQYAIAQLTKAW